LAKIIEFPSDKVKYIFVHVTLTMVEGLIKAYSTEHNNKTVTKAAIGEAFKPLYKNGLISVKKIVHNGTNKNAWYVTELGKKALRTCGIKHVS
jgi:hypothetical protein